MSSEDDDNNTQMPDYDKMSICELMSLVVDCYYDDDTKMSDEENASHIEFLEEINDDCRELRCRISRIKTLMNKIKAEDEIKEGEMKK